MQIPPSITEADLADLELELGAIANATSAIEHLRALAAAHTHR